MIHPVAKYLSLLAACILCDAVARGQPAAHIPETVSCRPAGGQAFTACRPDPADGTPSETDRSEAREPDRPGRRADTVHFLAYQVASIAILYSLPESTTGWTTERKEDYSLTQWWDNVQNPEWDSDDFFVNYVLHPYWGAAYFVRSRERGYGEPDSFWYAAALSAAYEFGAEALFENPSIQDLISTPVGGWLLGRYFMGVREDIMAAHDVAGERPFRQRVFLTMTDPLGAINRTVDRWFGLDQHFNIQPFVHVRTIRNRATDDGPASVQTERIYGFTFTYVW
jgi:hypothetical protein